VSPFGAYVTLRRWRSCGSWAKGVVFLPDRDKFGQLAETIQMMSGFLWVK
jgi:hypothetical protein